ncbi:trigger factor [Candidatus Hydrogenosomobacter endosymbioticus]|uniref:Trigger factor n=1 Tax=Candidatus Hydrogenosomobacter endosymbioticus TaxID=2558174 RepID=A0ABN6L356_9PROT|nr:trigger factor [Candidatus Hydrogenosomobacter endosymbioticus]BDB96296.1 trigger factor [Candidatus Hydrogenosomobacter endosymbioticus]
MDIRITDISGQNGGLKREFRVDIPSELLKYGMLSYLSNKQKNSRIDGFRPGKAPTNFLVKNFGHEAIQKTIENIANDASNRIAREQNFRLATSPKYEIETLESGDSNNVLDSSIKIEFELMPDLPEINLSEITLFDYTVDINDTVISEHLENSAKSKTKSEPMKDPRPAQVGDTLSYLIEYSLPSGETQTASGELVLGQSMFPKEFEKELVGISAGHEITQKVRVPKRFPIQQMSGQKVGFKVKFLEIKNTVPHSVDEDFAKSLGYETLSELKKSVAEKIKSFSDSLASRIQLENFIKKAAEKIEIETPEGLVEKEKEARWLSLLRSAAHKDASYQDAVTIIEKMLGKKENEIMEDIRKRSLSSVRVGILIEETIRTQNISASDEEIREEIEAIAEKHNGQREEIYKYYSQNREELSKVYSKICENKAFDWLISQCKHENKNVSIDELKLLAKSVGVYSAHEESVESNIEAKEPSMERSLANQQ